MPQRVFLRSRWVAFDVACLGLLFACDAILAQNLPDVSASHIKANVPASKDFDTFLKRDLAAYFREPNAKSVRVAYQLLRDGPTQSGVAYLKFYAWVSIVAGDKPSREGAVRVAAIDKVRFEVTDFVSKAHIARDPEALARIFPASLIPSILQKAGVRQ